MPTQTLKSTPRWNAFAVLRCTFKPPPVITLAFYTARKPKAICSSHQGSLEMACNLSGEEAGLLTFLRLLDNSPKIYHSDGSGLELGSVVHKGLEKVDVQALAHSKLKCPCSQG